MFLKVNSGFQLWSF